MTLGRLSVVPIRDLSRSSNNHPLPCARHAHVSCTIGRGDDDNDDDDENDLSQD